MKYNVKLLDRVEKIFKGFDPHEVENKDLYSYLASLVYELPYEDCLEWVNDKPNPVGKERRMRVKQMLLPIVLDCGGYKTNDCRECQWCWLVEAGDKYAENDPSLVDQLVCDNGASENCGRFLGTLETETIDMKCDDFEEPL